jgi:hypothetical protein
MPRPAVTAAQSADGLASAILHDIPAASSAASPRRRNGFVGTTVQFL